MATEIDKKIVEMELRNSQFESASKETMSTLDKLKEKLSFKDASDGLSGLSTEASRVNLSPISYAAEAAGRSFDAMSVVAFTALSRITNAAITAGSRIMSSLTIDPIKTGFQEYETKINSIQTILANTQARTKVIAEEGAESIASSAKTAKAQAKAASDELRDKVIENKEAEIEAYRDAYDTKKDLILEEQKLQTKALQSIHKETVENLKEQHDLTIELFKDSYSEQVDAMKAAYDAEVAAANNAHQAKLDMYDAEYMAKLKILDEDRYNAIKQIDDEIAALKGLTKAEQEAAKAAKDKDQLEALEKKVKNARSLSEQRLYEKQLQALKDKMANEAIVKERNDKIEALNEEKKDIQSEFIAKRDALKEEYDAKRKYENEAHKDILANMKLQQTAAEKEFKKNYEAELKYLQKLQKDERELMSETHDAELEALKDLQKEDLKEFEKTEKLKLKEINKRYAAELKAIQANYAAQSSALTSLPSPSFKTVTTKGSSLEDVKDALEKLNEYSDNTIYNFAEMTANIGRFTAAGIELDDSVKAIKGIANLGALSGSGPQQVATGMYQLSQALAAGKMNLQDWNSVVNAGFGGEIFQEELKTTARLQGIKVDEMIAKHGTFRESISEGWITSSVLIDTLAKFTGDLSEEMLIAQGYTESEAKRIFELGKTALGAASDVKTFTHLMTVLSETAQSGWATTWELLFGDFAEAKALFTGISNAIKPIINQSAEARNNIIRDWVDMGGRTQVIETISKVFNNVLNIMDKVKEAWYNVFPPINATNLMDITNGFTKLVDSLTLSEDGMNLLGEVCETVFGFIKSGIDIVSSLGSKLVDAFDVRLDTSSVVSHISAFNDNIKDLGVTTAVIDVASTAFDKLMSIFTNLRDNLANFDLSYAIDSVVSSISKIPERINEVFEKYPEIASLFGIGAATAGGGYLISSIADIFKGDIGLIGNISKTFEQLQNVLSGFSMSIKTKALYEIAKAVALLTVSLFALSLLDTESIQNSTAAIGALMAMLATSMIMMGKLTGTFTTIQTMGGMTSGTTAKQTSFFALAAALLAMAGAVAILAVAAGILSFIPIEDTMANITLLMGLLVGMSVLLQKFAPDILKSSVGVMAISLALMALVVPVTILGFLPADKIGQGLIAIGALLLEITIFVKLINGTQLLGAALGIMAISVALGIMTGVLVTLGLLVVPAALGLVVLVPLLLALAGAMKLMNGTSVGAAGLLAAGIALGIMTTALIALMTAISFVEPSVLYASLGTLGALILSLAGAAVLLDGAKTGAAALIGIAAALTIMTLPILMLSKVDPAQMLASVAALSALILVLSMASKLLTTGMAGATTLIVMAAGLIAMGAGLSIVAKLNMSVLGDFVLVLAALLATLVVAGAAAAIPVVSAGLAVLATSMVAVGAAAALFGAGALLIVEAITRFAELGPEGIDKFIAAILRLVENIPVVVDAFTDMFIEFLRVMAEKAPEIAKAAVDLIISLIGAIVGMIPQILEGLWSILSSMFAYLRDNIGPFFIIAGEIIGKMIDGLLGGMGSLLSAAGKMVSGLISKVISGITSAASNLFSAAASIGKEIVNGMISGVNSMVSKAIKAVKDLGSNMLNGIKDILNINSPSKETYAIGRFFDDGLVNGVNNGAREAYNASRSLGADAIAGLNQGLTAETKSLSPSIRPVMDLEQPRMQLDLFNQQLAQSYEQSAKMEGVVKSEEVVRVVVDTTKPIVVQGVNNNKELVAVTKTYLNEDALTRLIRRESRL